MDPKQLLEQFLASNAGQQAAGAARAAQGKASSSGIAGIGGGLAAGSLLGLLAGNKKARKKAKKLAGGALGYGGAAALGALGHRAYANWRAGKLADASPADTAPVPALKSEAAFLPSAAPASDGQPFELALVTAMVAAANADGHIDGEERTAIFEQAKALPLEAEDKAYVFDVLASPPSLSEVAAMAGTPEQAAELYLASRLAIDPDDPAEQAYLEGLAARLKLPPELVSELDAQMDRDEG